MKNIPFLFLLAMAFFAMKCTPTSTPRFSALITEPIWMFQETSLMAPGDSFKIKLHDDIDLETFKVEYTHYYDSFETHDVTQEFNPKPFKAGALLTAQTQDIIQGEYRPYEPSLKASAKYKSINESERNTFTDSQCKPIFCEIEFSGGVSFEVGVNETKKIKISFSQKAKKENVIVRIGFQPGEISNWPGEELPYGVVCDPLAAQFDGNYITETIEKKLDKGADILELSITGKHKGYVVLVVHVSGCILGHGYIKVI